MPCAQIKIASTYLPRISLVHLWKQVNQVPKLPESPSHQSQKVETPISASKIARWLRLWQELVILYWQPGSPRHRGAASLLRWFRFWKIELQIFLARRLSGFFIQNFGFRNRLDCYHKGGQVCHDRWFLFLIVNRMTKIEYFKPLNSKELLGTILPPT